MSMLRLPLRPLFLRLANVSPETIQVDQYAYVNAVHTIDDIMEYTKIKQIPGRMVVFDFEKAFDSPSCSFLFKTLKSFNLGNVFISWVSVRYSNISICILNYGFSTQMLEVRRGVRQGDPYPFIIALELLLISIRTKEHKRNYGGK